MDLLPCFTIFPRHTFPRQESSLQIFLRQELSRSIFFPVDNFSPLAARQSVPAALARTGNTLGRKGRHGGRAPEGGAAGTAGRRALTKLSR